MKKESEWKEVVKIILKHRIPIKYRGFSAIHLAHLIKKEHYEKLDEKERKVVDSILE